MFSKTENNRSNDDSSLAGIVMFLMVALALVSNQTVAHDQANDQVNDGAESAATVDAPAVDENDSVAQQTVSSNIQKLTRSISHEVAKSAVVPPTLDVTRVRFGEDEDESGLLVADADK